MPIFNPNPTALERARRAAGLSRKKLAELTGLNYRTIESYEQQKSDLNAASVRTVRILAKTLKVPIEKILEDDKEDNKK